jgi:transposase
MEFATSVLPLAHEANSVLSFLTMAPDGGVLKRDTTRRTEVPASDFSVIDSLDENACSAQLVDLLPPDGWGCPQGGERPCLGIHRRHRAPVLDDQGGTGGRVFHAGTGTVRQATQRRTAAIRMIRRGLAPGTPTASRARALGGDRRHRLARRHRLPEHARMGRDGQPRGDAVVAADQMAQNAGATRPRARRSVRPPRRRAQRRRGHGPCATARPPSAGVVRREAGVVRLEVIESARGSEREAIIDATGLEGTTVNTAEGNGSNRVDQRPGRVDQAVARSGPPSPGAIDADGDGGRAVPCNTLEGRWTGLRNFLRPFRGVSTWDRAQDVAVFPGASNLKQVTKEFLRSLLGMPPRTVLAP